MSVKLSLNDAASELLRLLREQCILEDEQDALEQELKRVVQEHQERLSQELKRVAQEQERVEQEQERVEQELEETSTLMDNIALVKNAPVLQKIIEDIEQRKGVGWCTSNCPFEDEDLGLVNFSCNICRF